MTTATYFEGRYKYARPQAVLWADNSGTVVNKWYATDLVADLTSGSNLVTLTTGTTANIIPGHNVSRVSGTGAFSATAKVAAIVSSTEFTVSEAHTASGTVSFQTGSFLYVPDGSEPENFLFLSDHNRSPIDFAPERIEKRERMINGRMRSYHIADKKGLSLSWDMLPSRAYAGPPLHDNSGNTSVYSNTADGGAGGNELLQWYKDHKGPFWVYLAYDNYKAFGDDLGAYGHQGQYNEILEMYIADFSYSVEKRSQNIGDLWNISVKLEEA